MKDRNTLPVADIIVGTRHRRDLGDLDSLAASIRNIGLLQPVVVTSGKCLVVGERRLAAIERLGWDDVPVRVVDGLDDALLVLIAERDENTCRKDFAPSEVFALFRQLEQLEREKAQQRKKATQAKPGEGVVGGGNFPPPDGIGTNGKTRDKMAKVAGMSGRTYERLKAVCEAAEQEPERYAKLREGMDRTGALTACSGGCKNSSKPRQLPPSRRRGREGGTGPSCATRRGATTFEPTTRRTARCHTRPCH
jgi:ParB-like nuclease domain